MNKGKIEVDEELFKKVKSIANKKRFVILWLTKNKEMSVIELSNALVFAQTKCTTYVSQLHRLGLVTKRKEGRQVFVKGKIAFKPNSIVFGQ